MTDGGPNTEHEYDSLVKSVAEADTDQDTCRICSAPAEPDQPLFHPCKCSGTIRYIHQDCLTTWLSHSKKKTCDVCKHPYSFTKVYADNMPRHLPAILLLQKLAQQMVFAILFCIRAIIVSFVWLAILPWVTVWTWRMYFAMGNSTAWWISARPRSPSSSPPSSFFYNLTSRSQFNSTAKSLFVTVSINTTHSSSNETEASTWSALAPLLLRSVSADIFTGQIIATLIVLVFIAVFLLREWISQNARPGVFEEGDPAIAAEREAEQERERLQQRAREQARAALEQRDIQLRRRQHAEAERVPRAMEGDSHQPDSSRRHLDQPSHPPSRRAHELRAAYVPQTAQLDLVASSSGGAGSSNTVLPTLKDDRSTPYSEARQEWLRAAEKRRLFALASTSSAGEPHKPSSQDNDTPPSLQAKGFSNAVIGNGKGKARAIDPEGSVSQGSGSISVINTAASVLAALKQKRVAWGIPGAESWSLYDFERFEMTRFGIDLMFSPHGIVAEVDPWQLIVQAEVDRSVAQDGTMSEIGARLDTDTMSVPDDWTEWLGHAVDDAWRWRARRRVLWERLREEAERDGLGTLDLPRELSGISIEEIYSVQDASGIWTPPPAPRLISRLPALTALPPTPSYPGATDDGLSLLSAHKQLRAEGSRIGRSFTVSTASIASPDEDEGNSRRGRQRTQSHADTKPFSIPPAEGGNDSPLFPIALQRPLPYPITPTASVLPTPTQLVGPSSHRSASSPSPPPSLAHPPFDNSLPPAPAIPIPRRPPMPNTTLPTPTSGPPSLLRGNGDSSPPASPSLATYQPPEEFQEGSARRGYFDGVEEGEGEVDHDGETMNPEKFERDASLFFKDELIVVQHSGKESRPNAEEEEEEEEDEGDLPGLLADSDEDGEEDARELRGAARRGQRRAAWGPEWVDVGRVDVVDEEDVVAEADDDGEDPEGEDVDDAALAAQLADEDLAVEDDMEGALEAIGMRGPLYVVAQNAALMIFVLDTAVGLGVWLPFTFGKSTALLSLDPRRALQVLHWPIRVIRVVTDPVVDSIFLVISYFILPSIVRMLDGFVTAAFWALSAVVPGDALEKSARFVDTSRESIVNFSWNTVNSYIVSVASKFAAEPSSNSTPSIITRLLESKQPIVVAAEPYVEALGKQARTSSYQVATGWTRMALGDGTGERVFAIALGYAVIGLLVAFYLNVFTVGSVKSAGRAVRSAVRQQLLVVKVATFIIIELVLFPLGCGINLDLCSIWLFPEASVQSRIAFFQYAPLTAIFYHWVFGTMFMYQFAILLAGCRTIMRPGAMWFIKDPSDQNFHPIRDILERPALVQLRKLSVSAIMYGLVVACGVGSIGGLMRLGRGIVLPLRWKPREPLSDVPIDLLFLHILLPYTLRFFRPRKVIRKTSITIWRYLCARLRLTSYMFGERHPEEERDLPHISWLRFGNPGGKVEDGVLPFHGSYRRVPNSDNVAVPRDMRATAKVDVNGIPIDNEARGLIAAQDAEAEKAKRNPKEDYTVVYIPSHFQYRIGLFIFALWVIGCVFVTVAVSAPILLGRGVFNLFTDRQMHDGYAFLVGFYALWGCWVVGHAVERMDKRRQRRSADDARGNWPLYFLKRSLLWLAKISYIVFSVGIVIPALLGLVVELYIVMPTRLSLNPDLVPNVRVVDMWALGIIYAKIALYANRLRPLNRITAGFNHIKAHGWTNPEPFSATAELIAPLVVGLVGMLALPPAIVVLLRRTVPVDVDQRFILMHVYPGIFAAAGLIRLGVTGSGVLSRWSQSIRDTEFLVEMRLRNYEQDKGSEKEVKVRGGGDADGVVGTEGAMGGMLD